MYQIIQFCRHKLPFIWDFIEWINCLVFRIRYGRRLKAIPKILAKASGVEIVYSQASTDDIENLVDFFNRQPQEAFIFFNPHKFDEKTIGHLIKNPSFIMILAKINGTIAGYSFLRCFMNGKAFRGKIVGVDFRGRGIAKSFGTLTTEIASALGLGLFGTISKANNASMASSKSSNEIKIIEELPNDYLLIQYLPKQ